MSFVHLHLRSNYSLLTGTAGPGEILGRARQLDFGAVALTDVNNLYGAIPFYKQAKELGLKPILGAELSDAASRAVLLARDLDGYANLCWLITRRNFNDDCDLCESIAELSEGLFILTEDAKLAERLSDRIDRQSLWIELPAPGRSWMQHQKQIELAERLGLGIVATGDVYFGAREDFEFHRLLVAIRDNALISDLAEDPSRVAHPDSYLMSAQEMRQRFADHPEAVDNAARIAEACNLDLPLGKPIFPRYELPQDETPYSLLVKKCHAGLASRYSPIPREAAERLTHELSVIQDLGFADYFLVVADILGEARRRRIPVVGRGSGASSIVAYVLGITSVDPIRYRLPFERFLNAGRLDCPDLDIDLCWRRRDEVIDYVYERFGRDRVAMISTHNCFRKRSSFREIAKAFGVSNEIVNRVNRRIMRHGDAPLEDDLGAHSAELNCDDAMLRKIADFAERIDGFPNHLSIHCGGIVIADRPIDSYVPLERAAKGIAVTQYEMNAIEDIGLVKIDLLGNRGLSAISGTIEILDAQKGPHIDPETIPEDDASAFELIRSGRTIGCCQLESPAMRHLLLMLKPESVRRVMQALALIRPAPASIGMKELFVRRARGLEETTFAHSSLREVLGDTFGIMLYEDDAMLLAAAMAGVSMEEGDRLRKAVKRAKSHEALKKVSRYFLRKSVANGVPLEVARDTWMQIAKFNEYSFCRAHAAGYGLVAYRSAYLKSHFPAAYMTSALNNLQGLYPARVHLWEARRLGVEARGPCVNRSGVEFICEGNAIRVGLLSVKGLTQRTIETTLLERSRGRFRSLRDWATRVRPGLSEAESLALVGAFDFTGFNRPQSVWLARMVLSGSRPPKRMSGATLGIEGEVDVPPLPDFSAAQKVDYEMAIIEMPVSDHPVALISGRTERRDWTTEGTENDGGKGQRSKAKGQRNDGKKRQRREPRMNANGREYGKGKAFGERQNDNKTTERVEMIPSPQRGGGSGRAGCPSTDGGGVRDRYSPTKDSKQSVDSACGRPPHPDPLPQGERGGGHNGFVRCEELPRLLGRRVRLMGILDTTRGTPTKNGELMQFITMEDETGVFEVTLFPKLYARTRRLLTDCGPYVVTGRVEEQYDSISITAERVERWSPG